VQHEQQLKLALGSPTVNKAEVSRADTLEQKRPSLLMESQCGDIVERKYVSKGRKTIAS